MRLVEQRRAVGVERIESLAGRLTAPKQRALEEALTLILDVA